MSVTASLLPYRSTSNKRMKYFVREIKIKKVGDTKIFILENDKE